MKRPTRRLLSSVTLGALLAAPVAAVVGPMTTMTATTAWAAADPAAAPAEAPVNKELADMADRFLHFAGIGRYADARDAGEKLVGTNPDPKETLRAFEDAVERRNRLVPPDRREGLDERLIYMRRIPALKETADKIYGIIDSARQAMAKDPAWIAQQVERLGRGVRAEGLAILELRKSGEMAVPVLLNYLRDQGKRDLHPPIRRALRELGIAALNPLLAATEIADPATQPVIIGVLGDLGYSSAVPYLAKVAKDPQTPAASKAAAEVALRQLGVANVAAADAAQLFYELAEKIYYGRSDLNPRPGTTEAFVWTWRPALAAMEQLAVPVATFDEDMTLRACEYGLMLDPTRGDIASLWIAAAYRREVQVPEGQKDEFWKEGHPDAHFYATAAGTTHLYPALARAMRDNDNAVALRAIKSLQTIIGTANLGAEGPNPVIEAMGYADRQVRFEAAFAVAMALPQQEFAGKERVVPMLAEAIGQTGRPGVVVVGTQEHVNKTRDVLKDYAVAGGETAANALANAASLSSVDVVLLSEENPETENVLKALSETGDPRLAAAARLIVVKSDASPHAARAAQDHRFSVTKAPDEAALNAAVAEARRRAGGNPFDEQVAAEYAVRAAGLLRDLAVARGQVLELAVAQPALLAGLDSPQAEVAKAVAEALGVFNSREAQVALALKAIDEKTAAEFKVVCLKNLARHAQLYRNQLEPAQVDAIAKLAESSDNAEVRNAAAEALGALNLKSEQIKSLILNQSQTAAAGAAAK